MAKKMPEAAAVEADRRRIGEYLAGEPAAFQEIEDWITGVLRACYPSLRDEREDVCQSVHEKLVSNLRTGRFHHRSSLRTYVWSVTHYTAIDRLRKKFRELPLDEIAAERAETGDDPYRMVEGQERSRLLHRALHLSSEACRDLWRMVFLDQLSYAEIARKLGIPPGTVKSRMYHCRKKAVEILRQLQRGGES